LCRSTAEPDKSRANIIIFHVHVVQIKDAAHPLIKFKKIMITNAAMLFTSPVMKVKEDEDGAIHSSIMLLSANAAEYLFQYPLFLS
jgi:hypothetical protein